MVEIIILQKITAVIGGGVMAFSLWIAWKSLKFQQIETVQQNNKIIELLEKIKDLLEENKC